MKTEFCPFLSYFFSFRVAYLTNISDVATFVCCAVLFLKLRHSKDGLFRFFLMLFFGTKTVTALVMAVLYHPLWNPWLVSAEKWINLIPLLILTGYILHEFWATKAKQAESALHA